MSVTPERPDAVEKAIWFIEGKIANPMSLDDVAESVGISRFAVSRAFTAATGRSIMGYVRGRRLTVAAGALANGNAIDILTVALDSGYGSHEAFTRAFREQFGITPEAVRAQRHTDGLALVHPIRKESLMNTVTLEPPQMVRHDAIQIAGLSERYTGETRHLIPRLWQRFAPHIGHIPGQAGWVSYGVIADADDHCSFDYIAGVEVSSTSLLPQELMTMRIPARNYAVFHHRDHIASIYATCRAIWGQWAPTAPVDPGPWLEVYRESFNARTGLGGVEIWIPVVAASL